MDADRNMWDIAIRCVAVHVVAISVSAGVALGMENYHDTVRDQRGNPISSTSVTVYNAGTSTLSTIYSDNGVTPLANPFTVDPITGDYNFYAAYGMYDIVLSAPSVTFNNNRRKRIALIDVADIGGGGGGGGGGISISTGTTLPATCTPGTGPNALFLNTAEEQLYACTTTDTLTPVGSGGLAGLDEQFDVSNGNIITGTSEAKPLKIMDASGLNGVAIYWHSAGRQVIRCIANNVEGDCNVGVPLNDGKSWSVTNSSGTSTYFKVDQATGKVSQMTADTEDSNVNITLYHRICGGDVVGVDPVSGQAGHIYERSALDTVTTATVVAGTNQTYGVARFPDVDGNYGLLLKCTMPPAWTGIINVIAWGKTTGTGNFRMQLATKCYSSNESPDAAFNTAVPYTLPAGTSNQLVRYFMTNPSMVGCASDEMLFVRAFRNRLEGLDTLNDVFDLARIEVWARNTY